MFSSRVLLSVLWSGLLASTIAVAASAEPSSAIERAREKANAGFQAFERSDYVASLELFNQAEALHHAPTHLIYVARSQRRIGQFLAAAATYQRIVDEQLPAGAHQAFLQTQETARVELAALNRQTPRITVLLRSQSAEPVVVTRNGEPYTELGQAVSVDPGSYTFAAQGEGLSCTNNKATVNAGSQVEITLDCTLAGTPQSQPLQTQEGTSASSLSAQPTADSEPDSGWTTPAGWSAIGAGTALSAAGVFFLIKAADTQKTSDRLYDSCAPDNCTGAQIDEVDNLDKDAITQRLVGTGGLVLGGLALATGVVFLLVDSDTETAGAASVSASVGPGSFHLTGRF